MIQAATKSERDSIEIKQRKLESIEFQKEMIEDEREELDEAKKHLKDSATIITHGEAGIIHIPISSVGGSLNMTAGTADDSMITGISEIILSAAYIVQIHFFFIHIH